MRSDNFKIVVAFLFTTIAVYGLSRLGIPQIINQALFLLLLAYIFSAKDDILWLAWFFIVVDAPGRLFLGGYSTNAFRLPMYPIAPGIALSFSEIFLLMYIVKTLRQGSTVYFIFKRPIWLFISVGLVYFGLSFVIGTSFSNIIMTIRSIMPWIWVIIIPNFVRDRDDLRRLYLMLVPIVLIAFAALIQTYATGMYLHNILSGLGSSSLFEASEESLARIYSAAYLTFFCNVLSLYYLSLKQTKVNANLLILISLLSTMSVFLSATRGWIIVVLILYSSFLFISGFGFFKQFVRALVVVGVTLVLIINLFPVITAQSNLALQRFMTVESLAQGDLTAQGTLSRLTTQSPIVMAVFRESPLIGWAFSNRYYQYANVHVGNQTNLLNFGVVGFIVINMIYVYIIYKTYQRSRRQEIKRSYGNSIGVFVFALFGLFFAHSSSGLIWGFYSSAHTVPLMWAFLFTAINVELQPDTSLSQ
jgi:hypothetical protein